MAATDTFAYVVENLPEPFRKQLERLVVSEREALFAARSEDARLRIVQDFIAEARNLAQRLRS